MKNMYDHQKKAVERFKDSCATMLAFDCGTGKTLTAIALAKAKKKTTLIIAPKAILNVWEKELLDCNVCESDIWIHDNSKYRRDRRKYIRRFIEWITS